MKTASQARGRLPSNERPEDLILLAKRHYSIPDGVTFAQASRAIISAHNAINMERMPWREALDVVLHDLFASGLVAIEPREMVAFVMELDPSQLLAPDYDQPGGFAAVAIDCALSRASVLRARSPEGEWLLPWPMVKDPSIQALLDGLGKDAWEPNSNARPGIAVSQPRMRIGAEPRATI